MADELKPCPFCGASARIRRIDICDAPEIVRYSVGCSELECIASSIMMGDMFETKDDAVSAWNKRSERTCTRVSSQGLVSDFCSECGESLCSSDRYCSGCGAKVVGRWQKS